jgi:hypothetical protein
MDSVTDCLKQLTVTQGKLKRVRFAKSVPVQKKVDKHEHLVVVNVKVSYPRTYISASVPLVIEDERDEYIADHVPAYCPGKKDSSVAEFEQKLLGSIVDFFQDDVNVAQFLAEESERDYGSLAEFKDKLMDKVFDHTRWNVESLLKSVKCVVNGIVVRNYHCDGSSK